MNKTVKYYSYALKIDTQHFYTFVELKSKCPEKLSTQGLTIASLYTKIINRANTKTKKKPCSTIYCSYKKRSTEMATMLAH